MRFYLVIFCFLIPFSSLFSQISKEFFDVFGLQGLIDYNGTWNDTLLPEKGNYQLKWRNIESENVITYYAKGNLQNRTPTGKWVWEQAQGTYSIEPGNTLEPQFRYISSRHSWQANFNKGIPNGNWVFKLDSLPMTRISQKENLIVYANYNQGDLNGKFTIHDKRKGHSFVFTGFCDEEGNASGTWEYQYVHDSITHYEKRLYELGFLLEIQKLKINNLDTLKFSERFDEVAQKLNAIKKKDSSILFRISDQSFTEDEYGSAPHKKFSYYFDTLFMNGWDLDVFAFNIKRNGPKFRKFEYPFSSFESYVLDTIKKQINVLNESLMAYKKNQGIYLNRGRNLQSDLAVSFMDILETKLELIDSMVIVIYKPEFLFHNRHESRLFEWSNLINLKREIKGKFFDSIEYFPIANFKDSSLNVLGQIKTYLDDIHVALNQKIVVLDDLLVKLDREGELMLIEAALYNQVNQLDSLYDDFAQYRIREPIKRQWTKYYINTLLLEYSQHSSFDEKKQLAHLIEGKIDTLIQWKTKWDEIENLSLKIYEYYTVYEYNPYTGKRDIEIRKKRRFFNKIYHEFWPWLEDNIVESKSWDELIHHTLTIYSTFDTLAEFANKSDKPSKRLEKRIRKEKSNARILRMLE